MSTPEVGDAELVRLVGVREAAGLTRKEALAAVAAETGLPKREVYDAVVAAKRAASPHGRGHQPEGGRDPEGP